MAGGRWPVVGGAGRVAGGRILEWKCEILQQVSASTFNGTTNSLNGKGENDGYGG
jgi:hypothetical protein